MKIPVSTTKVLEIVIVSVQLSRNGCVSTTEWYQEIKEKSYIKIGKENVSVQFDKKAILMEQIKKYQGNKEKNLQRAVKSMKGKQRKKSREIK